ncbi:hypothetical protein F4777DRAFT_536068 [Nemania sp. FL0916]|nr:hypothetical protein F4777DRAFT_536068 [Nemania sp. FL0916]
MSKLPSALVYVTLKASTLSSRLGSFSPQPTSGQYYGSNHDCRQMYFVYVLYYSKGGHISIPRQRKQATNYW